MASGDATFARWPYESAVGFPMPHIVVKYKRIKRNRPMQSATHVMCLPQLYGVWGCYLWFHMQPFVALRTGKAVSLAERLRCYDRNGGFSPRSGARYLKQHRWKKNDIHIAIWLHRHEGNRDALESTIQNFFKPIYNVSPPMILTKFYDWHGVDLPRGIW